MQPRAGLHRLQYRLRPAEHVQSPEQQHRRSSIPDIPRPVVPRALLRAPRTAPLARIRALAEIDLHAPPARRRLRVLLERLPEQLGRGRAVRLRRGQVHEREVRVDEGPRGVERAELGEAEAFGCTLNRGTRRQLGVFKKNTKGKCLMLVLE